MGDVPNPQPLNHWLNTSGQSLLVQLPESKIPAVTSLESVFQKCLRFTAVSRTSHRGGPLPWILFLQKTSRPLDSCESLDGVIWSRQWRKLGILLKMKKVPMRALTSQSWTDPNFVLGRAFLLNPALLPGIIRLIGLYFSNPFGFSQLWSHDFPGWCHFANACFSMVPSGLSDVHGCALLSIQRNLTTGPFPIAWRITWRFSPSHFK